MPNRPLLPLSLADMAKILAISAVYFFSAKLGLSMAYVNASATAVWPPAGIALASLLLFGYRVWPGVLIGAFLANALTAGNAATSVGIAAGNTLEGLAGAWLVNRFAAGRFAFVRPFNIVKFALLAGLVSTTISATIGVTSLTLAGFASADEFRSIWFTWWLGDMSGDIIVAPLIITWWLHPRLSWNWKRACEAVLVFSVLAAVGRAVFDGTMGTLPLEFLCMPALLWTAFRFGRRETAAAIFILSIIAVKGTIAGYGPFAYEGPNQSLLLLQSFMIMISITKLVIAAVASERRESLAALEERSRELKSANEKLLKLDELKSNFIMAASHELRTPMASIMGYISLLLGQKAGAINETQREFLTHVKAATDRLNRLVNKMLSISQIESGQARLEIDDVDLPALLNEETALYQAEANEKQIALNLDVNPALGSIRCDSDKIREVISNLISNALKYTPKNGRILISARDAGHLIEICVQDDGIGIKTEEQSRIFEPFHRLNKSGLKGEESTGLGLALVIRIVEAHRGKVLLKSRENRGSVFTVLLPKK